MCIEKVNVTNLHSKLLGLYRKSKRDKYTQQVVRVCIEKVNVTNLHSKLLGFV